jgi:hypothetical protein
VGEVPGDHWKNLIRETSARGDLDKKINGELFGQYEKMPYYTPGMEGGGLFMQYLPGIFLRENGLPVDISRKNFSLCQIRYAKIKGYYPFWGISACEAPDGRSYLGWGNLREEIVTPHAAVLAIEDWPNEVMDCLIALEGKGVRADYRVADGPGRFGFRDSFDIESSVVSGNYLILDQCMIFLSLANFLHNEIVREAFDSYRLGKQSNSLLRELETGSDLKTLRF